MTIATGDMVPDERARSGGRGNRTPTIRARMDHFSSRGKKVLQVFFKQPLFFLPGLPPGSPEIE